MFFCVVSLIFIAIYGKSCCHSVNRNIGRFSPVLRLPLLQPLCQRPALTQGLTIYWNLNTPYIPALSLLGCIIIKSGCCIYCDLRQILLSFSEQKHRPTLASAPASIFLAPPLLCHRSLQSNGSWMHYPFQHCISTDSRGYCLFWLVARPAVTQWSETSANPVCSSSPFSSPTPALPQKLTF